MSHADNLAGSRPSFDGKQSSVCNYHGCLSFAMTVGIFSLKDEEKELRIQVGWLHLRSILLKHLFSNFVVGTLQNKEQFGRFCRERKLCSVLKFFIFFVICRKTILDFMMRLTDGVRGVILSCEKLCFKSCVPEKNHKAMDKLGTLLSPPQPPLLRTTDSACRTRRGVFFLKARMN